MKIKEYLPRPNELTEEMIQLRRELYSDEGRLPIARYTAWVLKRNPNLLTESQYSRAKDRTAKLRSARNWRLRNPLSHNISLGIRRSLHGAKDGTKWESLVKFTLSMLKKHLEKQFLNGMSWDNYGEWEIDHIIPKSAFNFKTPQDLDFKRCWALSNLRPLWRKDNREKYSKLLYPFQPTLKIK